MNDLYVAAAIAALAAALFGAAITLRNKEGWYRILTGAGLMFLALTLAATLAMLGNTVNKIGDAVTEFGQGFSDLGNVGNLDDPTVTTEPLPVFPGDTSGVDH